MGNKVYETANSQLNKARDSQNAGDSSKALLAMIGACESLKDVESAICSIRVTHGMLKEADRKDFAKEPMKKALEKVITTSSINEKMKSGDYASLSNTVLQCKKMLGDKFDDTMKLPSDKRNEVELTEAADADAKLKDSGRGKIQEWIKSLRN